MLIVALVERGNLTLAEGIVKRVVDGLGRDTQARGGIAVNDDICLKPRVCWSLLTSANLRILRNLLTSTVDQ